MTPPSPVFSDNGFPPTEYEADTATMIGSQRVDWASTLPAQAMHAPGAEDPNAALAPWELPQQQDGEAEHANSSSVRRLTSTSPNPWTTDSPYEYIAGMDPPDLHHGVPPLAFDHCGTPHRRMIAPPPIGRIGVASLRSASDSLLGSQGSAKPQLAGNPFLAGASTQRSASDSFALHGGRYSVHAVQTPFNGINPRPAYASQPFLTIQGAPEHYGHQSSLYGANVGSPNTVGAPLGSRPPRRQRREVRQPSPTPCPRNLLCGLGNGTRTVGSRTEATSRSNTKQKKRSREQSGFLDEDDFVGPSLEQRYDDPPPPGRRPARSAVMRDLQRHRPPPNQPRGWDSSEEEELPRNKRRLISGGRSAFVDGSPSGGDDGCSSKRQAENSGEDPDDFDPELGEIRSAHVAPCRTATATTPAHLPATNKRGGRNARRNLHGVLQRQPDGSLLFRAHGSDILERTARHETMRRDMIDYYAQFGPYDETPAAGSGNDDVTSFNPPQVHWRFRGHQGWDRSQHHIMYRFERRDQQDPAYQPGPLRHEGVVILNNNDEVMTGYRDIPVTVSSEIEGGRMEMIQRLDSRITVQDFMERMPAMRDATRRLQGRSAFTNRILRYRIANGMASWQPRDGSSVYRNAILRHLSARQVRNNTTRGFSGLTEAEKKEIDDGNKKSGKYKSRAGKKALPRKAEAAETEEDDEDEEEEFWNEEDEELMDDEEEELSGGEDEEMSENEEEGLPEDEDEEVPDDELSEDSPSPPRQQRRRGA